MCKCVAVKHHSGDPTYLLYTSNALAQRGDGTKAPPHAFSIDNQ